MNEITILTDAGNEITIGQFLGARSRSAMAAHVDWLVVRTDGMEPYCVSVSDISFVPSLTATEIDRMRAAGKTPELSQVGWTDGYDKCRRRALWGISASLGSREQWKAFIEIGRSLEFRYRKQIFDGVTEAVGNYNDLLVLLDGDPVGTKPYWCDTPMADSLLVDIVSCRYGKVEFGRHIATDRNTVFGRRFHSLATLDIRAGKKKQNDA